MSTLLAELVAINGAHLEIRQRGVGEPVVFVHGAMGDECAAIVREPLLINQYHVIDYHRRGYGRSENPGKNMSIAQEATDLYAILRHLGLQRVHLVGQSYGGVVLLQMALDHPESVQSLALLEPALPSVMLNSPEFQAIGAKAGGLYQAGDKPGAMDAFGQAVGGADFRTRFDRTLPPGYFERWVADADTVFQGDMAALPAWNFGKEDAARITQPVLNVVGATTNSFFKDIYETIKSWLPQAENYVVADSPHCILQAQPKVIAERLTAFFTSHPRSRTLSAGSA
jgi:pimeloyl-ACP methyl ester carboxylesterase